MSEFNCQLMVISKSFPIKHKYFFTLSKANVNKWKQWCSHTEKVYFSGFPMCSLLTSYEIHPIFLFLWMMKGRKKKENNSMTSDDYSLGLYSLGIITATIFFYHAFNFKKEKNKAQRHIVSSPIWLHTDKLK